MDSSLVAGFAGQITVDTRLSIQLVFSRTSKDEGKKERHGKALALSKAWWRVSTSSIQLSSRLHPDRTASILGNVGTKRKK
jgi:hypothetical protein